MSDIHLSGDGSRIIPPPRHGHVYMRTNETKHCVPVPIASTYRQKWIRDSDSVATFTSVPKPVFKLLMVQLTVQTKFMLHTQLFAVWLCHVRCRGGLHPARSSPTVTYYRKHAIIRHKDITDTLKPYLPQNANNTGHHCKN